MKRVAKKVSSRSDLTKQIYIYSVDTSAFYSDDEFEMHKLSFKKKKSSKSKSNFREKLDSANDKPRRLRSESINEKNVVSLFDSVLTRTLKLSDGGKPNESLIIVRSYYNSVLKQLITNGFIHNNEKYIYYSSSAGQIRTKKAVFIKKKLWDLHKDALMCGLTVDSINKQGGANINKYLAYKALQFSASTDWTNFDIDRAIVVDDLVTDINCKVDFIDRDTYEITEKKEMAINIEHTDGAGMILPSVSKYAFMTRLPWIKGLLVPFDFNKFARECGNYKIKDIWNKEWDIKHDRIEIVFTKSQFKMWKYYESWEDYKNKFKEYKSVAAKMNEEDTYFKKANLGYQMLQTLTNITDDEIKSLSEKTVDQIHNLKTNKETMLEVLGATETNKYKTNYQHALYTYNELLNDADSKNVINNKAKKLINEAKSGRLLIDGHYTYISPDLYAFCEFLLLGKSKPSGLLKNGKVSTRLFEKNENLDVLRSPHLYREHAIRQNIRNEELDKWFITNCIYTSVHDPISKMLQFDVDGDKALVTNDKTLITVAERNMEGIVPLYYEMAKADPEVLNNENIYTGLENAFKANIGRISNDITKVWSSENPNLKVVKWLCMEGNFEIDYAKTLFKPKRPKHVDEVIKSFTKLKVPYFFVYAKDKEKSKVADMNNCVVNRLGEFIPSKSINFKRVAGEVNYKWFMSSTIANYNNREDIVSLYNKLCKQKSQLIKAGIESEDNGWNNKLYVFNKIKEELLALEPNINKVTNTLVELLFTSNSRNKRILWECFGDVMLKNLLNEFVDKIVCLTCQKRVPKTNNRQKYCCKECSMKK